MGGLSLGTDIALAFPGPPVIGGKDESRCLEATGGKLRWGKKPPTDGNVSGSPSEKRPRGGSHPSTKPFS